MNVNESINENARDNCYTSHSTHFITYTDLKMKSEMMLEKLENDTLIIRRYTNVSMGRLWNGCGMFRDVKWRIPDPDRLVDLGDWDRAIPDLIVIRIDRSILGITACKRPRHGVRIIHAPEQ